MARASCDWFLSPFSGMLSCSNYNISIDIPGWRKATGMYETTVSCSRQDTVTPTNA